MYSKYDQVVFLGFVSVDAGMLWVGDPCYVMADPGKRVPSWEECCDRVQSPDRLRGEGGASEPLGTGIGFAVHTRGDGRYPAFITVRDGLVTSVTVSLAADT